MSVNKMKSDSDEKKGELSGRKTKGNVKDGTDSELTQRGSERGSDVVIVVD